MKWALALVAMPGAFMRWVLGDQTGPSARVSLVPLLFPKFFDEYDVPY